MLVKLNIPEFYEIVVGKTETEGSEVAKFS